MTAPVAQQPTALRPREDAGLPDRLALSAAARDGAQLATADFPAWLDGRRRAHDFEVTRVPFAELGGWGFDEFTGNLAHTSGRFYAVEGLRVSTSAGPYPLWHQPIIAQNEVGVLGILVKEFDGVLHLLMQAKMEPGNRNLLQLSPTVQATRSNYTRVHHGAPVKYLEYFMGPRRGRVIADVLQSEHGWWFYRKRNRNMVIEVEGDVPLDDDFCWLTIGQVGELMGLDNVVNMDSRTVLSCLPAFGGGGGAEKDRGGFDASLAASRDPGAGALSATPDLLSWITGQRAEYEIEVDRVPLRDLPGWVRTDDEIAREDGRHFRVVGVDVRAGSREVKSWSQPLFEPVGVGVAAFVVKEFDGVLHVLVHSKVEGGFLDAVELGPTVQCRPGNYEEDERPFFYDYVMAADASRVRFDAVHSEEGGRFLNAESRYMVVEADDSLPSEMPDEFAWVTVWQMGDLLRHGHYIQVQARTLVACLNTLTAG